METYTILRSFADSWMLPQQQLMSFSMRVKGYWRVDDDASEDDAES